MSVVKIMAYGYMRLDTVIYGPKPQDSLFQSPPKETKTTTRELYGEVNSVKNTTINIWLNDGVY